LRSSVDRHTVTVERCHTRDRVRTDELELVEHAATLRRMDQRLSALGRYATKIDHVAIAVRDLDESIAFYQKQLGFELVERRRTDGEKTGMVSAVLRAGAIIIVLVQGTAPDSQVSRYIENYGPGVQHIAIEVRDVKKLMGELDHAGVAFSTSLIDGREIRQAFTARDRVSGMMYEFIERQTNEGDFTDKSVQELFEQLERNGAY
jgi:methylmalonyl-CoA/ethylmalonyl-CoA epimerase